MAEIEFNIKPTAQLIKDLTTGTGSVAQYLLFVGDRAKANAIALADDAVDHHSGKYQTSFVTELQPDSKSGSVLQFKNTQPYALVIEKGMQPKQADGLPSAWPEYGLIPVDARRMVNIRGAVRINGKLVVFRMSNKTHLPQVKQHPGIEARNVMTDAVRLAANEPYTPGRR